MTKSPKRFLIVDDDPLHNYLSKIVLEKILGDVDVKDFTVPGLALEYIKSQFGRTQHEEATTLFLDINMPTLTGWEFLDRYKTFNESVKNQFNIYILSSSIDPSDIQRAKLNQYVKDFIEKPLNKVALTKIFGLVS